jgi:hypothetical protein
MKVNANSGRILPKPPVGLAVLVLMFAAGALLLSLAQSQPARGSHATIIVTSNGDDNDDRVPVPSDGSCDPDAGVCTLREAIQTANAHAGEDSITLPADTYTLNIPGANEEASATGDLDITEDLKINGAGAEATTIDAAGATGLGDRVLDIQADVTAEISDLTITGGVAELGAGIDVHFSFGLPAGRLILNNSTVSGNTATGGAGGGGGLFNGGAVTVTNSTFSANSGSYGGGIRNFGALTLNNSTISNNSADSVGGGLSNEGFGTTITIANSTFSANSAGNAGGLFNSQTDATITITNSTFSANSANSGGGLLNRGTINIKNSIVANSPFGGDCSGTITSFGVNLSSDNTCGFVSPSLHGVFAGLDGLALNPPGTTKTHALCPTDSAGPVGVLCIIALPSVAIDAVTDCTDTAGTPVLTDQRGVHRPQPATGACDIGAYELQTTTCDVDMTKIVSPNPVQGGQPVTITLSVTNVGAGQCQGVTTVTDNLPTGLQVLSVAQGGSLWNCSVTGANPPATVTCTWDASIRAVPPGPLPPITITATVTAPPGSSQNCATVTNTNDINTANNTSCVTIQVTGTATPTPTPAPPVITGQQIFCIVGSSTGVDWTWTVTKGSNTYLGIVTGLYFGDTDAKIALTWVSSMNVVFASQTAGVTASTPAGNQANCFQFTPGVQTLTVRTTGNVCPVTPRGCSFNPTVFEVIPVGGAAELPVGDGSVLAAGSAGDGGSFPHAPLAGGVAVLVLAASVWYGRRRWLR